MISRNCFTKVEVAPIPISRVCMDLILTVGVAGAGGFLHLVTRAVGLFDLGIVVLIDGYD